MMINRYYLITIILIYSTSWFCFISCQITGEYNPRFSHELDYINVKQIPSILHNNNVYISVTYKCSSLSPRRISLSIRVKRTLYQTNFAVFRRHWFCQRSTLIKTRYVRVRLHRSLAYASDRLSNLQSWPIEQGQLTVTMYANRQENEKEILKSVQYDVRFLPISKRPNIRSFRWNPLFHKTIETICLREPEIVRIINYPLVLTGGAHGKYFVLPTYQDYNLRLEQQVRLNRPKFSIVFWLYIDEYYSSESRSTHGVIFQHLTFNNTRLTPELFLNREGQIIVNMFEYLHDRVGTGAQTLASVPKHDWCRVAFIVNEFMWSIYVHCLKTWDKPITAFHHSPTYCYHNDEFATFIIGGSDLFPSFRGFIARMDIYRRVALTYEQLPTKPDIPFLPLRIQDSIQCKRYIHSFQQCREQYNLFNKRIQHKFTCNAHPFLLEKSNQQCPLIRTWKRQPLSTSDVRYRIFRALRREKMNSTNDVANKLFDLSMKLLETDDFSRSCHRIIAWSEQAMCYGHPAVHSLLATFYQFGLCNLERNTTRALELLLSGAFYNDRISLLALAHRHVYGLDGVPLDYDAAYVYYRQMAMISKNEHYYPKSDEVAMESIRLTDDKLIGELTFEKSESFYWLKQQAVRGVAAAQNHLGDLMYGGRNGLPRNVQAAVEYFRLGAEQHDAVSHFSYGLALLKGQGTKQNITEAIRQLEKAVEYGYPAAQVTLGYHAYEIEKNYTKAAQYWKDCFDRTSDANCAYNLGVMWTSGQYPPESVVDHVQAWKYFSFAAQHGQIDAKIIVAYYNIRGGHPVIIRNPWLGVIWSRHVAEESSAVGTIVRRALEAYRDRRWQTSFVFYIQAALAGVELGYFNAGYLCTEFRNESSFDCVEKFLNMYLMIHGNNENIDSYALLTTAEYYLSMKSNATKAMQLYVQLYQNDDPQGLYNLAQVEENSELNGTIPLDVWNTIGIKFDEKIVTNRYRRLQIIYQHCRTLKTAKSDESYIPCTLAYLRISTIILFDEHSKLMITILLLILTTFLFFNGI